MKKYTNIIPRSYNDYISQSEMAGIKAGIIEDVEEIVHPVAIKGDIATAYDIRGLRIYGRCTQGANPSSSNPQTIHAVNSPALSISKKNILNFSRYILNVGTNNGVTVSKTSDNKIHYSGTPTGTVNVWHYHNYSYYTNKTLTGGDMILEAGYRYYIYGVAVFGIKDPYGEKKQIQLNTGGLGTTEITLDKDMQIVALRACTPTGQIDEDIIPYIGIYSTPETFQGSYATLSGITLNAIPVTTGGNVTIDGQQYIADYVDIERKQVVRWVDSSKLVSSESIYNKTSAILATPTYIALTDSQVADFLKLTAYSPETIAIVSSNDISGACTFISPGAYVVRG